VKKSQSILALSVLSIAIISFFAAALAQSVSGTVWTTDNAGTPSQHFLVNQEVWVHWEGLGAGIPMKINHTTGSQPADDEWLAATANSKDSSPHSFFPEEVGEYRVWVGETAVCVWYSHVFFVVPESLFGSLGAVGAASAAGLVYYRRKRR